MRCLWITRQDPLPANSGELIYSSGLARSLAEAGAEVTLVAHDAPAAQPPAGRPLPQSLRLITTGPLPGRKLRNFLSPLPSDADRLRSTALEGEVRRQLATRTYDVVLVDHAALGWAGDLVSQSSAPPKLVYLSHNCEAVIRKRIAEHCGNGVLKRALMQRDARKYARLEQRLCHSADLITAITPADRSSYECDYPLVPVIDLMPGYELPEGVGRRPPIGPDVPRRVLMVGSFEWIAKRHNLEETLEIAEPVFVEQQIELQVVGKCNPAYARAIERRYRCATFHPNVPEVTPYLEGARLGLISEAVGGGFKLKTLEYAFHRLPIAALKQSLGGIELNPDVDAIIEPTLGELIASIARRIDDFNFLNTAAARTLARFSDDFRWANRGTRLLSAIERL